MRRFLLPLALAAFALPVHAADMQQVAQSYLVPYIGDYALRDESHVTRIQVGLEYRWHDLFHGLRPMIGGNVDSQGDVMGYIGGAWDIPVWNTGLVFTPSFAPGLYTSSQKEGDHSLTDGKSLGGGIEFRSQVELAYQFDNASRAGIALNHVSNASLYSRNPGAETVLVDYQIPFSGF